MPAEASAADWPGVPPETFSYAGGPDWIRVIHRDALFNCCPDDIVVDEEWIGPRHVRLREREVLGDVACACLCPYDVETVLPGLEPGEYRLEVFVGEETQARSKGIVQVTGLDPVERSECLPYMKTEGPLPPPESFEFIGGCNAITIRHNNATFNCCLDAIVARHDQPAAGLVRIFEKEIVTIPCDCVCPYNVAMTATSLPAGRYKVELYREWEGGGDPLLVAAGEAVVVDCDVSATLCRDSRDAPLPGREPWDPGGKIDFTVEGDSLIVRHADALYNCCLESLTMDLRIEGDALVIVERAVLEGSGCRCNCLYDLKAVIDGLPPGWYPVEVILDSGQSLQSGLVEMPGGATRVRDWRAGE